MDNNKKNTIKICMGSSCFARGNNKNLEIIEEFIKKESLETDIELIGSRCENQCAKGPYLIINNKEYTKVSESKLKKILKDNFLLIKKGK